MSLAQRMRSQLKLRDGERAEDAISGCLGVALRRAALFGRAPVIHDLQVAFGLFGFLSDAPDADLLALRTTRFRGVASPHHYAEARGIATRVPESTLRLTPAEVAAPRADWLALIGG